MSYRHYHRAFFVWLPLLVLSAAWAQDTPPQAAGAAPDRGPQQPAPAYGPENSVSSIAENPPISGLDMPNLEPHAAPLSYLQAGAHLSEAVSSNLENTLGGSGVATITNGLGSLELQRLWSNYNLALVYLGGVGYYDVTGIGLKQIEELGIDQKITWKRGELNVRDAFSYQPEGTFGSSYGSVATIGAAVVSGQSGFFGGTGLGALGQVPRIMNLSVADVVESLTPKSSITAAGGYGFVHFLGNEPGTGTSFIGNGQVTGQVAYDRLLGPHDQGAIVYMYQGFNFSTGVSFHSNIVQLMWGHRISGRMDFLIGAGPQFTQINNVFTPSTSTSATIPPCEIAGTLLSPVLECPSNDFRIGAAGQASLRYRFSKASLELTYSHFLTSGSGFFAGAESDIARLNATRPLGRIWTAFSDIGYSRNSRVTPLIASQTAACNQQLVAGGPSCPGVGANTYQYGFAGFGVRRNFGRTFKAYASYQFNELSFDNSYCGTAGVCSRISQRHVGTIGLDWTPRPIRLD
ncbi:MAG: hypothetical protein WB555_23070 [Candidatus Korobacteraceae bacterium]